MLYLNLNLISKSKSNNISKCVAKCKAKYLENIQIPNVSLGDIWRAVIAGVRAALHLPWSSPQH